MTTATARQVTSQPPAVIAAVADAVRKAITGPEAGQKLVRRRLARTVTMLASPGNIRSAQREADAMFAAAVAAAGDRGKSLPDRLAAAQAELDKMTATGRSGRRRAAAITPHARSQARHQLRRSRARAIVNRKLAANPGRRDRLIRQHVVAVTGAWNHLTTGLDAHALAEQVQASKATPGTRSFRDAAFAATLAWLGSVYQASGWNALVDAIKDAIRSGMAEGEADALAAAATRQGVTGLKIDRAFKAAYRRLDGNDLVSRTAADTASRIVRGAAADAARKIVGVATGGGSGDDMADGATGTVTGGDIRSVTSWITDGMWSAAGLGAVSLFMQAAQASSTAVLVDWVTESGNPCPICQDNEDDSPYLPGDVPPYIAHPNCQCDLVSDDDIPSSFFSL